MLKSAKTQVLYVPGEHDFDADDTNKLYLERSARALWEPVGTASTTKACTSSGWSTLRSQVRQYGRPGQLGQDQLQWLTKDLAWLADSKPIVVFAHVPLWTVYEKWGWGTQDAEQSLALLKRFGSVTILNGHIHQVMQKVEGRVVFHTARSTAFPQSEPGKGTPGPMRDLPANRLRGGWA